MRRLFPLGYGVAVLCLLFGLGYRHQEVLLHTMELYQEDIFYLSVEHIELVAISGGLAIVAGVLLGVLLSRAFMARLAEPLIQVLNIGATIPTLAVLALSMSVLGVGKIPALFALWVMALLPIVRNTYAGLKSVAPHLVEAAQGMGMRPFFIVLHVELPNALLVIFAGVRTAIAINIGTAPLAFLIGGGGLGELIFTGIDLNEIDMLLAGVIPVALLAVLLDFILGQMQYWLIPRGVNPAR
ncbi:ABC transporter permease [Alcaligenes endophyticus]|uniref:ABC transporter permease n=1 Tax=Alcaligenes endophyticus TaxID=1929088 RepID=A0ABT8EN16_9BURK|nr:ABC transporter permease [Alcaligenes endophyticus]MCX5591412.1 ABC transporter permease [Alcaligenes endophyticus]MDN4122707.1 ABC transporter permease [Alcaligenes endophyticus]